MNAQSRSNAPRDALQQILRGWDRRLRLVQSVTWLPRALMLALAIGILLAVASRLAAWLLPQEIMFLTGIALVACSLVALLVVWLYPRQPLALAQRFDRDFDLRERTSAALELIDGRIRTSDELATLQIEDALVSAQAIRARERLPLQPRWREWGALALLVGALALLLILPNPQAATAAADEAQNEAIADAADELREITAEVAADPDLSDEDRQALLEALQAATETLEQPDITREEALAAISDAESALRDVSDSLTQEAAAQQAALNAAADALRDVPTLGEEAAGQLLAEILEAMSDGSAQFGDAGQQSLTADQLDAAANSLQDQNPALAEALRDAVEALRNGDTAAAQQALQQAQQAAQAAQDAAQQQGQAGDQLQQNAQQAGQAGQQVGQQGQPGAQQPGQNPQAGGQPGDEQGDQQGGDQPGQGGQPGENAGQQGGLQQGQGGGDQGSPGQGDQPGQGGQPGDVSGEGAGQQGGAGAGAGDEPGGEAQAGGAAGQPDQNNNPDAAGERPYDQVYAPTRLGGDPEGPEISLEPNAGDMPVQQGDFAENSLGSVSVPYNEVFGDYADAANEALEADYVPLGLRDVVRDYFTGLEPGQGPR
jgi:hypothetical protein